MTSWVWGTARSCRKSGSLWSPACQHKFAFALPSTASAWILPPLSSWPNLQSEWNVPKWCWCLPLLQFFGVTRRSHITTEFTLAMTWSFRLVEGRPECGSLSTNVWPSLNRLYHSLTRQCWLRYNVPDHISSHAGGCQNYCLLVPVNPNFCCQKHYQSVYVIINVKKKPEKGKWEKGATPTWLMSADCCGAKNVQRTNRKLELSAYTVTFASCKSRMTTWY